MPLWSTTWEYDQSIDASIDAIDQLFLSFHVFGRVGDEGLKTYAAPPTVVEV
jgi:hypothetical protein